MQACVAGKQGASLLLLHMECSERRPATTAAEGAVEVVCVQGQSVSAAAEEGGGAVQAAGKVLLTASTYELHCAWAGARLGSGVMCPELPFCSANGTAAMPVEALGIRYLEIPVPRYHLEKQRTCWVAVAGGYRQESRREDQQGPAKVLSHGAGGHDSLGGLAQGTTQHSTH